MGDCPNDVTESEISPDATFLKRALDAKLETGKTQNFTPRVGTANSITWWISISSSQVHEKFMKTEFSPELERVWFRSFRVFSMYLGNLHVSMAASYLLLYIVTKLTNKDGWITRPPGATR